MPGDRIRSPLYADKGGGEVGGVAISRTVASWRPVGLALYNYGCVGDRGWEGQRGG